MRFQSVIATVMAVFLAGPVWADILVHDAYARAAMPTAPSGAIFMTLENTGIEDDFLIAAASDVAQRVELHTHIADEQGVMRMRAIDGGISLPAGASHALARGGDHVMLLGLTRPLVQGETVALTLTFEQAGEVIAEVPIDLERMPEHGAMHHGDMDHGDMKHGDMKHGDESN